MPDVEFQGLDSLQLVMRDAPVKVTQFLLGVADNFAADVFEESQRQVPVRYGILKGSGHVEPAEETGDGIEISIGYGGAASAYAVFVHENVAAYHRPPTKAKFLEDPFNQKAADLPKRLEGLEAAMVGQSTVTPQRAAAALAAETKSARTSAARVRRSKAMTPEQVHAALQNIARGNRRMQRGR